MIDDEVDWRYLNIEKFNLKLLELYNNREEHFYGLIKNLELPIYVVSLLDEGGYLSLDINNNVVGLVLTEGREGG